MIIDCDTCAVRDVACHDCVVGVLLGTPTVPARPADATGAPQPAGPGDPLPVEFGPVERRALEVLADHGLIPRLQLVPRSDEQGEPSRGTSAPPTAARRPRRRDVG